MAEWIAEEGHPYTGIFKSGGDTGFVRLSSQDLVREPGETEGGTLTAITATIAVKFLRDGIDSANAVANGPPQFTSYDFFENSMLSNTSPFDDFEERKKLNFVQRIRPSTAFVSSVGHFDFAAFEQDGTKVDDPVIPYSLRYEPNPDLSYTDDDYTRTFHEHLADIAPDTLLYTVFAQDKPKSQGGIEQEMPIGKIYLRSQMVTSTWADEQMFFKHQRHDDDFRINPDWETSETDEVDIFLLEGEVVQLHPTMDVRRSSCPFQWLMANFPM